MNKQIATGVLKVMMVWLLALMALKLYAYTLAEPVILGVRLQGDFFVGAFLAGVIISLIAIVALALRKKDPLEVTDAKRNYSSVGLMISVFGIIMMALGNCFDPVVQWIFGSGIQDCEWYIWVRSIAITDVICLIAVILVACKIEKTPIERHKMSIGQFITGIFMNAGVIGLGLILGLLMEYVMLQLTGNVGGQVISEMMQGSNDFWRIITVGIGAPIVEELIFRKFLIDRVHKYGEGIAIFVSGIMFGLFHGNFAQFFHATGVGLFLAFIYVRTGRIWYSILIHMVVNLSTSVVSMMLIENLDFVKMDELLVMDVNSPEATQLVMELLPSLLAFMLWILFLMVSVIVGWVLWIVNRKKLFLKKAPEYVEKKKLRTAFLNFGMIYFLIVGILRFVSFYI